MCDHPHCHLQRYVIFPNWDCVPGKHSQSHPRLLLWGPPVNGIIRSLSFCVRLIACGTASVPQGSSVTQQGSACPSFFLAAYYFTAAGWDPIFASLSIRGWTLGFLHMLAVVSHAAVTLGVLLSDPVPAFNCSRACSVARSVSSVSVEGAYVGWYWDARSGGEDVLKVRPDTLTFPWTEAGPCKVEAQTAGGRRGCAQNRALVPHEQVCSVV